MQAPCTREEMTHAIFEIRAHNHLLFLTHNIPTKRVPKALKSEQNFNAILFRILFAILGLNTLAIYLLSIYYLKITLYRPLYCL